MSDIGRGVSQRSIEKWKSGSARPSQRNIHKLARVAGGDRPADRRAWADAFTSALSTDVQRMGLNNKAEIVSPPKSPSPTQPPRTKPHRPTLTSSPHPSVLAAVAGFTTVALCLAWVLIRPTLGSGYGPAPELTTGDTRTVGIAVSAFENTTGDRDSDYLLSGLRRDLGHSLSQVEDIDYVTPRELAAVDPSDRSVSRERGPRRPDYILSGEMAFNDGRDELALTLSEFGTERQLWARGYDLRLFTVSEINRSAMIAVAQAIGVDIPAYAALSTRVSYGTSDPDAHTAYLKGRFLLKSWHETRDGDSIWAANRFFEEALSIDPDFGLAAFHSADAFYHLGSGDIAAPVRPSGSRPIDPAAEISAAMRRAGETSGTPMQMAQFRVNQIFFSDDWTGLSAAAEDFVDAAVLERGELEWFFEPVAVLLSTDPDYMARLVEQRMARFDPLNGTIHAYGARSTLIAGRYDEAKKRLEEADVGSFSIRIQETKGYLLIAQNDADSLSLLIQKSNKLSDVHRDYFRVMQHHFLGDTEAAKRLLMNSAALEAEEVHRAIAWARLGDAMKARELFERIEQSPMGTQRIAVAYAYGAACGDALIPIAKTFALRLEQTGVALPSCSNAMRRD